MNAAFSLGPLQRRLWMEYVTRWHFYNTTSHAKTFLQYNLSHKDISTMQHPLQWHLYNKICDFISQFAVCDKKAKYQLPLWHEPKYVTQWHFPNDRVKDSSCLLSLAPGVHSLWCWRLKVWHTSFPCFLFPGWSCNEFVCCKTWHRRPSAPDLSFL